METTPPFNLYKWIEDNKQLLRPPVGNKNLYVNSGDYIIMIVGGPNARKDFHYNQTEELFFQLEGTARVFIQENDQKKEMLLTPGDMFLLPAGTPHSPMREENSIGLVVESRRVGKNIKDGLLWFCENCNHKLYEVHFELTDIEKDFLPHFKMFYNSEELRTCTECGQVMEADERFVG